MTTLDDEINHMVEYFNEIDKQFEKTKKTIKYQNWAKSDLPIGVIHSSKAFSMNLWVRTPKERTINQSVTKIVPLKATRRIGPIRRQ